MSTDGRPADRSLGQLVGSVTQDVSALLRLEIELAKSELQAQAKQGATGAALALVAVGLLLLAMIMASFAAAFGLAHVMPDWAAFLVVAGVYILVAVILVLLGVRRFKRVKGPQRAQAAAIETKEALQARQGLRREAATAGMTVPELRAEIASSDALQQRGAAGSGPSGTTAPSTPAGPPPHPPTARN